MKYYDLYGTRRMTIDELQQVVGSTADVAFRRRYNDDLGDYYKTALDDETFEIVRNFADDRPEDEVLRPQFADFPVLLFVNGTTRGDEIRDLLLEIPGLEHLTRRTQD